MVILDQKDDLSMFAGVYKLDNQLLVVLDTDKAVAVGTAGAA